MHPCSSQTTWPCMTAFSWSSGPLLSIPFPSHSHVAVPLFCSHYFFALAPVLLHLPHSSHLPAGHSSLIPFNGRHGPLVPSLLLLFTLAFHLPSRSHKCHPLPACGGGRCSKVGTRQPFFLCLVSIFRVGGLAWCQIRAWVPVIPASPPA